MSSSGPISSRVLFISPALSEGPESTPVSVSDHSAKELSPPLAAASIRTPSSPVCSTERLSPKSSLVTSSSTGVSALRMRRMSYSLPIPRRTVRTDPKMTSEPLRLPLSCRAGSYLFRRFRCRLSDRWGWNSWLYYIGSCRVPPVGCRAIHLTTRRANRRVSYSSGRRRFARTRRPVYPSATSAGGRRSNRIRTGPLRPRRTKRRRSRPLNTPPFRARAGTLSSGHTGERTGSSRREGCCVSTPFRRCHE